MSATLRDVAERAGVSVRSVSNVVNDFHYVSPEMRAKVQAAIDELNYAPNLMARGLRQGRTGIITLLVPEIAVHYFGELAHEIVERASQLGFTVMIDETGGRPQRERALLEASGRSGWVDGVLLSSEGLTGRELAALRPDVPVVLLGERTANTTWDHVGIDNVRASRDAVQHLLDSGRRRIAAVGGSSIRSDVTSRLRLKGYRAALRAAGLQCDDRLYVQTPKYRREDAAAAVRVLMSREEPPDALFCFNDELAVGSLREFHEQGLRVPDDISVVGFDDLDESRFTTPSLTSVSPRKAQIASTALDLLIDRIGASEGKPRDVRVDYELVVRESSSLDRRTRP